MPAVLGAEPGVSVEWDDDDTDTGHSAPRWIYSKGMSELVNFFAYHPRMKMTQRCNEDDKVVLARWITRKRKQGYNDTQIKSAMSRFFQSYAAEYDTPAYAISSNTMQDKIFEVDDRITSDDPILQWMLDGMPDDGPMDDPKSTRQLLLVRGGESLVRYPEVVAAIIALPSRMRWKERLIVSLNLVIDWNNGKDISTQFVYSAQEDLEYLNPPKELLSNRRGAMREAQSSMQEAVAKHQYRETYRSKSARAE